MGVVLRMKSRMWAVGNFCKLPGYPLGKIIRSFWERLWRMNADSVRYFDICYFAVFWIFFRRISASFMGPGGLVQGETIGIFHSH